MGGDGEGRRQWKLRARYTQLWIFPLAIQEPRPLASGDRVHIVLRNTFYLPAFGGFKLHIHSLR
jgi:hypothetical protein